MGFALLALVAIGATSASASSQASRMSGPWTLAFLPEMGTVTWSCDGRFVGMRRYALRFRTANQEATERVTLRAAGRVVVSRTINPGPTLQFPHLRSARQRVTVAQTTEPGTLRATVDVDFGAGYVSRSHCFPWLPPAVTVHVYPR